MSVSRKNRMKSQNRLKAKNKKLKALRPFTTPYEELNPIEPDEFYKVFGFAMAVGHGRVSLKNDPTHRRFSIKHEDDTVQHMKFGDSPFILMIAAISEMYEQDTAKCVNITSRFFALLRLINTPELAPWIKNGKTSIGMPEVVIKAAAVVKLQPDGNFKIADIIAVLPPPQEVMTI